MAELDIKQVSTYQWMGIGAGALAFINTFLPWFSASAEGPMAGLLSRSANAWEEPASFLAWFTMLVLVLAGVVAALPLFGVQIPQQPLVWLGLAGVSLVLVIVKWFDLPGVAGMIEEETGREASAAEIAEAEKVIDLGAGFGLYLGIVLALVSLAGAFLAYRASSTTTAPPAPPVPPAAA